MPKQIQIGLYHQRRLQLNGLISTCVQVSMSFVVPPIVMFLNKHPMVAKADLSSLNQLVCGAAPLGPEMVDEFHSKNPNCYVGQGLTPFYPCLYMMT